VRSDRAENTLRAIYAPVIAEGVPVIVTDLPTAELVKASANAFLATKISFINAMAEICEVTGADVTKLADALGHDPRIGRRFLHAGLGFGGGCLPKDIRAFIARAGEIGAAQSLAFLAEVDSVNLRRRERVVEIAREMLGGDVTGKRVAVLGAAFKPNSDDVRDSPALTVAGQLQLQGAEVTVHDPKAMDNARRVFPTLTYTDSTIAACRDADVVLHLTEWLEFREIDPAILGEVVRTRNVVDGRNCLDAAAWRDLARYGWRGLHRRPPGPCLPRSAGRRRRLGRLLGGCVQPDTCRRAGRTLHPTRPGGARAGLQPSRRNRRGPPGRQEAGRRVGAQAPALLPRERRGAPPSLDELCRRGGGTVSVLVECGGVRRIGFLAGRRGHGVPAGQSLRADKAGR
jgi:hypothetical protein